MLRIGVEEKECERELLKLVSAVKLQILSSFYTFTVRYFYLFCGLSQMESPAKYGLKHDKSAHIIHCLAQ